LNEYTEASPTILSTGDAPRVLSFDSEPKIKEFADYFPPERSSSNAYGKASKYLEEDRRFYYYIPNLQQQ
jgi:hypothetical protein